ncbi:hypothetical protein Tco_0537584 [Tanacetum coccineum]
MTDHPLLLLPYLKNLKWEKALLRQEDKSKSWKRSGDHTKYFDNLETELQKAHTQIAKLQRKHMENNSKIALARFRIANLEQIIEDIQAAIRKLVADSVAAALEA